MDRLIELDAYLDEVVELNLFPQGISTRKLQRFTPNPRKLKLTKGNLSKIEKMRKSREGLLKTKVARKGLKRPLPLSPADKAVQAERMNNKLFGKVEKRGKYIKPEDTPLGKIDPELAKSNRKKMVSLKNRRRIEQLQKEMDKRDGINPENLLTRKRKKQ